MRRLLFNLTLFLSGIAAALGYLHSAAPNRRTFWNEQFLPHLSNILYRETEAGETPYGVAFGSSLTCHNFVPPVFEATLAEAGFPMRVYNLGVAGANAHEVNYYLRRAIGELERQDIPLPSYVFLDLLIPFTGRLTTRARETQKSIEWHDPYETMNALRTLGLEPLPPGEKYHDAAFHLLSLMRRHFPVGWGRHFFGDPLAAEREDGVFHAGFQLYPKARPLDPGLFAQQVEEKIAQLDAEPMLDYYNIRAVKDQMAFLLGKGIMPVYYLPPSLGDTRNVRALAEQGVLPSLTAFDDPRVHPEFWQPEDRFDLFHLESLEPSERFTRALARELARTVLAGKAQYLMELNRIAAEE